MGIVRQHHNLEKLITAALTQWCINPRLLILSLFGEFIELDKHFTALTPQSKQPSPSEAPAAIIQFLNSHIFLPQCSIR
jgi:hypothetical protein